jgi:hypothetical protein
MHAATVEDQLAALIEDQTASGCALVTPSNELVFALGTLRDGLGDVAQFTSAFALGQPAAHVDACGERAVVVRANDSWCLAVACRKRLGLTVHLLAAGVLVVAYTRAQLQRGRAVADVAAVVQGFTRPAAAPGAPL